MTFSLPSVFLGESGEVPADGAASWQDVAGAAGAAAVVGLQLADAAAGQAVHRQEARLAHAARLLGVGVDLAVGKLPTRQELTGVGLVGCGGRGQREGGGDTGGVSVESAAQCGGCVPARGGVRGAGLPVSTSSERWSMWMCNLWAAAQQTSSSTQCSAPVRL